MDESGTINVHFCPQENCEQLFISQLEIANKTLDCALYEIDEPHVWQALDAAVARNVTVRVVMDGDYMKDAQIAKTAAVDRLYVRFDTASGLMHNKFCIVDGHMVTSGSMNPTVSDMTKNFNNIIFINAADTNGIAQNYETEFSELWAGKFRQGAPNAQSQFVINGTRIEQYFCPDDNCEAHVIAALKRANTSIRFMTFSFTSFPIANAIIAANKAGVLTQGLYEKRQVNDYSVFNDLTSHDVSAIAAKNPTGGQLHDKVFIIDNETVVTGSYNPTKNGDEGNDENILIIHNPQIAGQFLENYAQIHALATN